MYCSGAGSLDEADDDDGVIHRAVLGEGFDDAGRRAGPLAAGDVDADDAGFLLVDDRVDGDRRSCRSCGRR